jgi:hypothetical protein
LQQFVRALTFGAYPCFIEIASCFVALLLHSGQHAEVEIDACNEQAAFAQVFLGCSCEKERSGAARKLLIQSATHVSDLMKKAANGSDADLMAYAEATQRLGLSRDDALA